MSTIAWQHDAWADPQSTPCHSLDMVSSDHEAAPRTIAFYLPQFHPIPENDEWWGKGFTEWTNVARSTPRYRRHVQPDLPGELGFYDLRLREVQRAQIELARYAGLDAFCYYHYWFNGRRLLSQPIDAVLADSTLDFPFLLCWANESWTRRWDGADKEVLIGQQYSDADDLAHAAWLADVFADPRYLRIDGRPVYLVYRVGDLPDPALTVKRWQSVWDVHGLDVLLLRVAGMPGELGDPRDVGFEGSIAFVPSQAAIRDRKWSVLRSVLRHPRGWWPFARRRDLVLGYDDLIELASTCRPVDYPRVPCVVPGWDNSARRKRRATVIHGSSPERYGRWLRAAVAAAPLLGGRPTVFVNAWNEWAEGAHLEPGARWGRQYLDAHRRAVERARGVRPT
jgi:O-antigen biosynthesis protein